VGPPHIEVLGAQVIVKYQGKNSVILKLLSCRDSYCRNIRQSSQFGLEIGCPIRLGQMTHSGQPLSTLRTLRVVRHLELNTTVFDPIPLPLHATLLPGLQQLQFFQIQHSSSIYQPLVCRTRKLLK